MNRHSLIVTSHFLTFNEENSDFKEDNVTEAKQLKAPGDTVSKAAQHKETMILYTAAIGMILIQMYHTPSLKPNNIRYKTRLAHLID
jgi:hypothetical protein